MEAEGAAASAWERDVHRIELDGRELLLVGTAHISRESADLVREVIEALKRPRAEVLETLVELAEAGFVERVDVQKVLRVQSEGLFAKDTAGVDERLEQDWAQVARFARGVLRVEVRGLSGKVVTLPVEFRPGLIRDVHLPRNVVAELNVTEGEDVTVRPVA